MVCGKEVFKLNHGDSAARHFCQLWFSGSISLATEPAAKVKEGARKAGDVVTNVVGKVEQKVHSTTN